MSDVVMNQWAQVYSELQVVRAFYNACAEEAVTESLIRRLYPFLLRHTQCARHLGGLVDGGVSFEAVPPLPRIDVSLEGRVWSIDMSPDEFRDIVADLCFGLFSLHLDLIRAFGPVRYRRVQAIAASNGTLRLSPTTELLESFQFF